jgi:hypothetical protein
VIACVDEYWDALDELNAPENLVEIGHGQAKTRATPTDARSGGIVLRGAHRVFLLASRLLHHHSVTMHETDLACGIT